MADQTTDMDSDEKVTGQDNNMEELVDQNLLHKELYESMWNLQWDKFLVDLISVTDVNQVLTLRCTHDCRLGKMFESFSCTMDTWFSLAADLTCQCLEDDYQSPAGDKEFVGVTLMHLAATLEDAGYLRELMRRGGFVNARTLYLQLTPLNLAAHKSQINTLRLLLSTCSSNAYESQDLELHVKPPGSSQTCKICDKSQSECDCERDTTTATCNSLSDHSMAGRVCDVNVTGRNGRTAFLTAVMHDFKEGAEELMKYGADVNKFDTYATIPVIEATRRSYPLDFFEKMVIAGCKVDASPTGNHDVALHYAVYMEMVPVVELLLKNGTNPDKVGQSHTPLVISAFVGCVAIVRALVKYGANVNKSSPPADYTALHFAAWEGHLNICEELVKAGSNADAQTRDLNTPLSLGAHGNYYKVVDFFLKLGVCDVNNQDKDRDTALHYAAYNGDVESTKALLENNAAANARNDVEATPLWNACYMNRLDVVMLLVKHNVVMELCSRGIDQHSQTDEVVLIYDSPKSPLYAAAEQGGYGIVKYLVKEGYALNKENWIQMEKFPARLISDEEMRNWIEEEYRTPRSLIESCRCAINKLLGEQADEKSNLLEIPNTLRDYLLHKY